jgi:hypothetical protein
VSADRRAADQLVSQADTIGALRAENAALVLRISGTDSVAEQAVSETRSVRSSVPDWRALVPWLGALLAIVAVIALLAIVAVIALLAWPRW